MHKQLSRLLLTGLLALLAACSTAPKPVPPTGLGDERQWRKHQQALGSINDWQLSGKIAIRNAEESGNGNLNWQQQKQHFDIRISGPLGQGAVQLSGTSKHLELTTPRQKLSSSQPELLMQQQLGWNVPLQSLLWWVRGLPDPDYAHLVELNDDSRAWRIEQGQWLLEYLSYQDSRQGLAVPQRIRASGPQQLQIILIIKDWQ